MRHNTPKPYALVQEAPISSDRMPVEAPSCRKLSEDIPLTINKLPIRSVSFRQPLTMRSDGLRKVPTKDVAASEKVAYAGPMPGKPFQSKLVPFEPLIRDLRTAGRTYREISEILKKRSWHRRPIPTRSIRL